MLVRWTGLKGFALLAKDGEIGTVKDVYFDDETWAAQYFVVDTGGWLTGRNVLISPEAVEQPDWDAHSLPTTLTREQIEHSPPIFEDQPVSRRARTQLGEYFHWSEYWVDPFAAGPDTAVALQARREKEHRKGPMDETRGDPHLRSAEEIIGYTIAARDAEAGQVEDFLIAADAWAVRYVLAAAGTWRSGRTLLVSPVWIRELDWVLSSMRVDLARESIREAPAIPSRGPMSLRHGTWLHHYYARPRYWDANDRPAEKPSGRPGA